jgi:hypothetical protein
VEWRQWEGRRREERRSSDPVSDCGTISEVSEEVPVVEEESMTTDDAPLESEIEGESPDEMAAVSEL